MASSLLLACRRVAAGRHPTHVLYTGTRCVAGAHRRLHRASGSSETFACSIGAPVPGLEYRQPASTAASRRRLSTAAAQSDPIAPSAPEKLSTPDGGGETVESEKGATSTVAQHAISPPVSTNGNIERNSGPAAAESSIPGERTHGLKVRITAEQQRRIEEHRTAVQNLLTAVEHVNAVAESDIALLRAQLSRLADGLFLLVVVGEYNSGKSSCINAILGRKVVKEGVVPTTAEVTVVRHSGKTEVGQDATANEAEDAIADVAKSVGDGAGNVVVISQDARVLEEITLVDSPGTNAIDRRHEALTKEYLPMCDLVLFVTSADRPFSESERLFLKSIRSWGKKCVLIVNKADLLPDSSAREQVMDFVRSASGALLGSSPHVFPVSSRQAYEAKVSSTGASGPHWDASGFEALESYISSNLDAEERLRIKLDSIASVAAAVAESYIERLRKDREVIAADQAALQDVQGLVSRFTESVESGFAPHFARVENVLLQMTERADTFLDNHVTITNTALLWQRDAVADAFVKDVVDGTARDLERKARGLAEWVSDKSTRNIADVSGVFSRRVGERKAELAVLKAGLDEANPRLRFASDLSGIANSEQLVSGLSDAAAELAEMYQPEQEGKRIASALSSTVNAAIAMELGAAGVLGAYLGFATLDVTGVATTTALATGGLLVLPRKRRIMRAEFRDRVASLRARLKKELNARVLQQMASHEERVTAALEPFATMTAAREESTAKQLVDVESALNALRGLRRKLG